MKISKKIGLSILSIGVAGILLAGCGKAASEASSATDSVSATGDRAALGQLADKSFGTTGKSAPPTPSTANLTGQSIRLKAVTTIDGEDWEGNGYTYLTTYGPDIGTMNVKYYYRTAIASSPYTTLMQYYTLDNKLRYTMRCFFGGDYFSGHSTSGFKTVDAVGNFVDEQTQENTQFPDYTLRAVHYRTPIFETEAEMKDFGGTPPVMSAKATVYYGGKSSPYAVFRITNADYNRMEFTIDITLKGTHYTYEGVFVTATDFDRRWPSGDVYRYPKKDGDLPVARFALREDSRLKVYMYKPDGTLESNSIVASSVR